MNPWHLRPREIRNLFNPAFCGLIIARGIEGYKKETGTSMPFSLTLLILPLCLHKLTREQIKKSSRSYFIKVLQENPEIMVGLANRVRCLFPYTMEAFAFLMDCGAIEVDASGRIDLIDKKIKKSVTGTPETTDCQTVAISLGRKLGLINDRTTIYTTLGIRP